jgi:hypothetical protein
MATASRDIVERDGDLAAQSRRNVHEGVERETGDAAAAQVVDAGLGYVAALGGFGLGPAALLHDGRDLLHERGAQAEVGCFHRRVGQRASHPPQNPEIPGPPRRGDVTIARGGR